MAKSTKNNKKTTQPRRKQKFTIKNFINSNSNRVNLTAYWVMKFIISVFILYVSYLFGKKVSIIIVNQLKKNVSQHKKLIIKQLSEIVFYIVFGFGIFIALINLGVQTTTIVTILGTILVTIGLALQSTLSNVFAGVYVALSENFQLGDVIRVYVPFISKPIEGKVIDFNMAYVKIQEANTQKIMYLPNTSVAGNVLINLSQST